MIHGLVHGPTSVYIYSDTDWRIDSNTTSFFSDDTWVSHSDLCSRLRELWQPSVISGRHPVHERFPNWYEEIEGAAEAFQERQQALLKLQEQQALSKAGFSSGKWSLSPEERLVRQNLPVWCLWCCDCAVFRQRDSLNYTQGFGLDLVLLLIISVFSCRSHTVF